MKQYSFWSNFKFAFGPVWKEQKRYVVDILLEMILAVIISVAGAMISALIIWLLGSEITLFAMIVSIIAIFLGYAGVNAAQSYVKNKHDYHHIEIRVLLFYVQKVKKQLQLSLEKTENGNIRLLEEKAQMCLWNNWGGLEGFFRYASRLGVGILGLVVYSFIAGTIHPWILFMLFVLSVLSALIDNLPQWYYNKTKNQQAKEKMTMEYLNRVVDDIPAGKDIRVYGLRKWLLQKYDSSIMKTRQLSAKKDFLAFVGAMATITANAIRDLVCYLYLIHCLKNGMSITQFVFYLGIVGGFSGWFNQVSQNLVQIRNCSKQIEDLRRFLDLKEEQEEGSMIPQNGFEKIDIEFDHVTFQYSNSEKTVLKDVSFHIAPGEHFALVGVNGAGKSTIAKLISGLYLPTKGEIRVNGVSTRDLNRSEYFSHVAAVFQDAFTLSYNIAENVSLQEEWEEEKVLNCLKRAELLEKVKWLPEGIYTYLGKDIEESGISLSGGETQKLLLARALYRNPSMMLLDEPTAAMDALAESRIYDIYSQTLKNITSLFISHRLASTRFCHNIILLENGVIKEQGTHEELMLRQGSYFNLFKIQSKYYEASDTLLEEESLS